MLSKNCLLVLAYNEQEKIYETIDELADDFDSILVVNDYSKDNTLKEINKLISKHSNVKLISNKKNMGAGKSFQIGLNKAVEDNFNFIVKIDGDGQFLKKDIIKVLKLLNSNKYGYVKANRFWEGGIKGEIPFIRFLGNSFLNFLIKFNTGSFKINDPLNGLMGFNSSFAKTIKIKKKFYRYGYPFYINSLAILNNIYIKEIKNTIIYHSQTSSKINPLKIFFKTITFSLNFLILNIKTKAQVSELQISSLLDIVSLVLQSFSLYLLIKFISVRYFNLPGLQSNFLILFLISQLMTIFLFYKSKILENDFKNKFIEIE